MRKICTISVTCVLLLAILPMVNAGTVTRVFDTITIEALTNMNVTLVVEVVEGTEKFYAIDEIMPSEWTLVDPGFLNDSQTNHLKKMNTSDASDTSYTYEVRSPAIPNPYGWSGIFQIDGMGSDVPILGSTQVTVALCPEGEKMNCIGPIFTPQNDTGQCVYSQETCVAGVWDGICTGGVDASDEVCDGLDSDCNGVLDGSEGLTQTCGPQNETGLCSYGSQDCNDGGGWDACTGYVDAANEVCPYTSADENCDGGNQEFRGDVNCDAVVDIADLVAVSTEFGTAGVNGDLNSDSTVDIFDLVIAGSKFGSTYPIY